MPAIVDVEKCDGCKSCEDACPSDAIKVVDAVAMVNAEDCIDCNACEDACPNQAVKVES